MTPTLRLVLVFGCLGMLLLGYDTGVVSGALVLVRRDIQLTTDETEWVVSITLLVASVSAILGIPLNSCFGRRPVVFFAACLYIAGSVIIAFAAGYPDLMWGRTLLGFAIGLVSGTIPMYAAEMSPAEWRGMIVTMCDLNIVIGQLVASLVNVAFEGWDGGWRWSMGLAAIPAVVLALGFAALPESPRWLLMSGRREAAERVLRELYGREDVESTVVDIMHALEQEGTGVDHRQGLASRVREGAMKLSVIWRVKEVRRAAVLGIGLMALNQLSGINTVMYYSATILIDAGFSKDASIALAAVCGAVQLLGVCFSVFSMDSRGRRATALTSCTGVVASLSALSFAFLFHGAFWDWVKVVALMLYLVAFGSGLSGVPWVVNAEVYPLNLRAAALAQAVTTKWILNWLVGRYFLTVCESFGEAGAFAIFAAFTVAGGAWMYAALPETAGLELEDISQLFQDRGASTVSEVRPDFTAALSSDRAAEAREAYARTF